jgi:hypothetical protein
MPTKYLHNMVLSQPRDAGLDGKQRQVFSFTVLFTKHASGTFAEEVVALLKNAGVAEPNVDLFMGSKAAVPIDAGPYVHLMESGGTSNERVHNAGNPGYERPGLIVRVYADDYLVCRDKAKQAFDTLVPVSNQTVTF